MSNSGHNQGVGGQNPAIMTVRLREQVSAIWFGDGADTEGAMDIWQSL